MTKITFEEIEPVMEDCTKAEVTSQGAPWLWDRVMVSGDVTNPGYYATLDEFERGCSRIQSAFNVHSGNGAAGIPVDLSDKSWQEKYASEIVRIFVSAASIRAEEAAAPKRIA